MGRVLVTVFFMALWACSGAQTKDSDAASLAKKTFPQGYETWTKINAETIFREETEEEEGVAREIYGKLKKDLKKGTILVKADHAYMDGVKGEIRTIAVMRRVVSKANGGWQFESYDPKTRANTEVDAATCVGCHSLQAENDYLFTPKDVFFPAPEGG